MGLLTLIEDRPTPKEVYNWRVYFSAAVAGENLQAFTASSTPLTFLQDLLH
jgi:hypothetical protein